MGEEIMPTKTCTIRVVSFALCRIYLTQSPDAILPSEKAIVQEYLDKVTSAMGLLAVMLCLYNPVCGCMQLQ